MRANNGVVAAFVAAGSLALLVWAQAASGQTTPASKGTVERAAHTPYTATYRVTHTRTMANGSANTQESTEVIGVDSQGRRVTETTPVTQTPNQKQMTRFVAYDPMARTNSVWTVPGREVTVTALPAPGARPNCATGPKVAIPPTKPPATPPEKPTVEDLGMQTIDAIQAHGRRTTRTIPAGEAGNATPQVSTSEVWTAADPGLRGLVAREINDNPRSGRMTMELQNLVRGEPNPSLFQPPAGYAVVNKPAPGSECPGVESTPSQFAPIPPPPPPQ